MGVVIVSIAVSFFRGFLREILTRVAALLDRFIDSLDESQQERVGGFGHLAVVIAVQFHDLRVRMFDHLHHAPEVGVLLVASQHLKLAVACNE